MKSERTTISVTRADLNELGRIAAKNGWTVGKAAAIAIRAFSDMDDAEKRRLAYAMELEAVLQRATSVGL